MKNFLKENWLKISVLACLLMAMGSILYYFVLFLPKQTEVKNTQNNKVNKLQTQLIAAQKELEEEKNKQPQVLEKAITQPQPQVQATQQDPTIKIEKCKTQAKNYADSVAKRGYLQAFEKAQAAGDTQTAQMYLEFSFKPEHPADYNNNYNSEYIKCLDN